jgi:hypothetical protein
MSNHFNPVMAQSTIGRQKPAQTGPVTMATDFWQKGCLGGTTA